MKESEYKIGFMFGCRLQFPAYILIITFRHRVCGPSQHVLQSKAATSMFRGTPHESGDVFDTDWFKLRTKEEKTLNVERKKENFPLKSITRFVTFL